MSAAAPGMPNCGAEKRQGEGTCTQVAGWGTDHVGTGRCKLHGGCTPTHRQQGARAEAAAVLLATFPDQPVSPHDVLQSMLDLASGQVGALADLFRQHAESVEAGERPDMVTTLASLELLGEHMDRAVRFAKVHLDAGVDERRVQIDERLGALLGDAFAVLLDGFGLRQDPRAPELVRAAFRVLEGGKAAA